MNITAQNARQGFTKMPITTNKEYAMRVGLSLIILLLSVCPVQAYTLDQWANAIRITEGNQNYGILSVKTHNPRLVCKNTVRYAFRDFMAKKGNPSDLKGFIIFLANRYCPISADPIGNRNWKHNMEVLLCHGKTI